MGRLTGHLCHFRPDVSACSQEISENDNTIYLPDQARFTDVTQEAGLEFEHGAFRWDVSGDPVAMMGGGLCWLDYDQDGWLDLYAVNSYAVAEAGRWESEGGGLPRNALFRNDEGQFSDVSDGSGDRFTVARQRLRGGRF